MLLAAVLLLCVLTVPLAGGRLMRLADLRFRAMWALIASLGVQVVIISIIPSGLGALYAPVHLGTYGLAAWFLVVNRRIPGLCLVGLGGALNLLVIAANGGVMPATPSALATAGLSAATAEFENSTVLADPRLPFLGDIFALPASIPLANVFSVGDICIALGAAYLLHRVSGSRILPGSDVRSATSVRASSP